jgi:tryptophanyl-tRNA synthetase
MTKKRVLSGMRATGDLHLGHLHGVLKNWVNIQEEYHCVFLVADWHSLTTHYAAHLDLQQIVREMILSWLSVGIDPTKAHIAVQSLIPEHAVLHVLLSMMTPLSWLERVPTYKDQQQKLQDKDLSTYGFLGYPLLQSADILIYQANAVPVGEDQIPHIEFCRDVARRFNFMYGEGTLIEPQYMLTKDAKMPGLDGQKMSKSYGNTISLKATPDEVTHAIKTMPTDPARVRRSDPGTPEKCPVWAFHQIYSDEKTQAWVQQGCTTAGIGCLECKRPVIDAINAELAPIRAKRAELEMQPGLVDRIVKEGTESARVITQETLKKVNHVMGLDYDKF